MGPHDHNPDAATAFREAISQWQLAARTEVKRASSLPSSMFDATDAMVEARLGETVDVMMRLLQRPNASGTADRASGEHLERRTEQVSTDELQALPGKIRRDVADADLDDLVASEYLNLLIDACTTGDTAVQRGARELLARDFAVPTTTDLDEAAAAIGRSLQAVAGEEGGGPPLDRRRLAELSGAIAATVVAPADPDGAAQR